MCHGAVALLNIRLSNGELLVQGKALTGFTNEEEKLAGLDAHVPYLTETELVKRGVLGFFQGVPGGLYPFHDVVSF